MIVTRIELYLRRWLNYDFNIFIFDWIAILIHFNFVNCSIDVWVIEPIEVLGSCTEDDIVSHTDDNSVVCTDDGTVGGTVNGTVVRTADVPVIHVYMYGVLTFQNDVGRMFCAVLGLDSSNREKCPSNLQRP